MVWATGQLLQSGRYQIIRQIGGGGFGLTYLAEDQMLHRQVVIKAPNRTLQRDQDYEKFVRRFQREGQILDEGLSS
jgi:eukaryotic-like serine/threonine-protein kinase